MIEINASKFSTIENLIQLSFKYQNGVDHYSTSTAISTEKLKEIQFNLMKATVIIEQLLQGETNANRTSKE